MSHFGIKREDGTYFMTEQGYEERTVVTLWEPRFWRFARWSLERQWQREESQLDRPHAIISQRVAEGWFLAPRHHSWMQVASPWGDGEA